MDHFSYHTYDALYNIDYRDAPGGTGASQASNMSKGKAVRNLTPNIQHLREAGGRAAQCCTIMPLRSPQSMSK